MQQTWGGVRAADFLGLPEQLPHNFFLLFSIFSTANIYTNSLLLTYVNNVLMVHLLCQKKKTRTFDRFHHIITYYFYANTHNTHTNFSLDFPKHFLFHNIPPNPKFVSISENHFHSNQSRHNQEKTKNR